MADREAPENHPSETQADAPLCASAPLDNDERNDQAMSSGADLIAAERQRQIQVEGWSIEHDREHGSAMLYRAASCYANVPATGWQMRRSPIGWPWEDRFWKPKGTLRNLIRAGALYQAALDVADPEGTAGIWSPPTLTASRALCAAAIDSLLAEVADVVADRG